MTNKIKLKKERNSYLELSKLIFNKFINPSIPILLHLIDFLKHFMNFKLFAQTFHNP